MVDNKPLSAAPTIQAPAAYQNTSGVFIVHTSVTSSVKALGSTWQLSNKRRLIGFDEFKEAFERAPGVGVKSG